MPASARVSRLRAQPLPLAACLPPAPRDGPPQRRSILDGERPRFPIPTRSSPQATVNPSQVRKQLGPLRPPPALQFLCAIWSRPLACSRVCPGPPSPLGTVHASVCLAQRDSPTMADRALPLPRGPHRDAKSSIAAQNCDGRNPLTPLPTFGLRDALQIRPLHASGWLFRAEWLWSVVVQPALLRYTRLQLRPIIPTCQLFKIRASERPRSCERVSAKSPPKLVHSVVFVVANNNDEQLLHAAAHPLAHSRAKPR
jgi:hypothetical protein